MTTKESLVAVLQGIPSIPDNSLEKALADHDVTSSAIYTKEDSLLIDTCAIDVLQGLLSFPDVSEGGFSQSFDRKAVEARIGFLANKHGLDITIGPTVTSPTVW